MTGSEEPYLALPDAPARGALLVLSGSSGRIQRERCDVLSRNGFAALSPRWFDPDLVEVPVESFTAHLDRLAGLRAPWLGVLGTSFGALAALPLGVADPRLDLVAALAPSDVVWGRPC